MVLCTCLRRPRLPGVLEGKVRLQEINGLLAFRMNFCISKITQTYATLEVNLMVARPIRMTTGCTVRSLIPALLEKNETMLCSVEQSGNRFVDKIDKYVVNYRCTVRFSLSLDYETIYR